MPSNIPILRRNTFRGGNTRVRPINTSGNLGPAIQTLAKGGESLAAAVAEVDSIHQKADRQQRQSVVNAEVRQQKSKWEQYKGSDAVKISSELDTYFETLTEQSLTGVENSLTSREIQTHLLNQKQSAANWAFDHINSETAVAIKLADKQNYNDMQGDINSAAVGDVGTVLTAVVDTVAKNGEFHKNPEILSFMQEQYTDEAMVGAYTKWFTESPAAAVTSWRTERDHLKSVLGTKAYNAIAQQYKRENASVILETAFSEAVRVNGGNYKKAADWVLSDAFSNKFPSIKHQERMALYGNAEAIHAARVREYERGRRESDITSLSDVIDTLYVEDGPVNVKGALELMTEMHRLGKMTPSTYFAARKNAQAAQWVMEPETYYSALNKVLIGDYSKLDVLNEAMKGGLGHGVTKLIATAESMEAQKEKDGRIVNHYSNAMRDYSYWHSTFAGSKVTNAPSMTVGEYTAQVMARAVEIKGGPVTGFDPEVFTASQEILKKMPQPEFAPGSALMDYHAEAEVLFKATIKQFNKKGKSDTQPTPGAFARFMDGVERTVSKKLGRPVEKGDAELYYEAERLLTQGWVGTDGKFREGASPIYIFGETEGARYMIEQQTATGGNLTPEEEADTELDNAGIAKDHPKYSAIRADFINKIVTERELSE